MRLDAATRHRLLGWVWVALIIPSVLFWKDSIMWVSAMSHYANIASEFAASHAARLSDEDVDRIADAVIQRLDQRKEEASE